MEPDICLTLAYPRTMGRPRLLSQRRVRSFFQFYAKRGLTRGRLVRARDGQMQMRGLRARVYLLSGPSAGGRSSVKLFPGRVNGRERFQFHENRRERGRKKGLGPALAGQMRAIRYLAGGPTALWIERISDAYVRAWSFSLRRSRQIRHGSTFRPESCVSALLSSSNLDVLSRESPSDSVSSFANVCTSYCRRFLRFLLFHRFWLFV